MNLKQLGELVDGYRARGVHGLTEVVIRDDGVGSTTEIEAMRLDGSRIVITPHYVEAAQPANVEDDDE